MQKGIAISLSVLLATGGRNVTISLQSRTGHMSMKTAVGLLVFCQFWYWFPFCHFLSLAFTPTAAIGLNSDLKVSSFSPPSTPLLLFVYLSVFCQYLSCQIFWSLKASPLLFLLFPLACCYSFASVFSKQVVHLFLPVCLLHCQLFACSFLCLFLMSITQMSSSHAPVH